MFRHVTKYPDFELLLAILVLDRLITTKNEWYFDMSITIDTQQKTQIPYRDYNRGSQQPYIAVSNEKPKKDSKLLKPASFLASTAGVCLAITHIAKKQDIKLLNKKEFSDIFKLKNWNFKDLKYDVKEVFQIATASTLGGLSAGIALDPENKNAKIREGLQQMVGNLLVPIGLVAGVSKLFDKYDDKIAIKNKHTRNFLKIGGSLGALGVGMVLGNKIANELNEHFLGAKQNRDFKASDLAGQIDDVCLATLIAAPENKFLQKIGQFIPLALIVPGYETGTKKSNYKEI